MLGNIDPQQLKYQHQIYNADFEMKEKFEEFLNKKLMIVENSYKRIYNTMLEIMDDAQGHELAEEMRKMYQCSYVKNLDNFLRRKIKISKFDRCFII